MDGAVIKNLHWNHLVGGPEAFDTVRGGVIEGCLLPRKGGKRELTIKT